MPQPANLILDGLSAAEHALLQDDLEAVVLQAGEVLSHVYFPTGAIISLRKKNPEQRASGFFLSRA